MPSRSRKYGMNHAKASLFHEVPSGWLYEDFPSPWQPIGALAANLDQLPKRLACRLTQGPGTQRAETLSRLRGQLSLGAPALFPHTEHMGSSPGGGPSRAPDRVAPSRCRRGRAQRAGRGDGGPRAPCRTVLGITGAGDKRLVGLCDASVIAPGAVTSRIQETPPTIAHLW